MKIYFTLIVSIIFLTECSTKKLTADKETDILFEMSKTPCFGYCPVYDLAIYQNGLMKLNAKNNLTLSGNYIQTLSKSNMKRLKADLKNLNLLSMNDEYKESVADAPGTKITYHEGEKVKAIITNFQFPAALQKFTDSLDDLVVNSVHWEKYQDNRQKQEYIIELRDGSKLSELLKRYDKYNLMLGKRLNPNSNLSWVVSALVENSEVDILLDALRNDSSIQNAQLNRAVDTNR